jgi:pimeloyl-ACP methyl ester carboxylesterase
LAGWYAAALLLMAAFALPPRRRSAPGEAALVAAARTWDVTGRLGEVGLPVLLVGGTRDRLVPPELMCATAAGIPDARLVLLPGRGHLSASFRPARQAGDRGVPRGLTVY